jgi:hypothetical protein
MQTVTYTEGREQIRNGDILAFHTTKISPFGPKVVSFFTGSSIYHVGIAVWLYSSEGDRRLFIVEANKGNRQIVPLSLYAGERIDVYKYPVMFKKFSGKLLDSVGFVKYSYIDLPIIWLKEKFGIELRNQSGEVCSEMIAKMFDGTKFQLNTSLISPGKLIEDLVIKGMKIRVSLDK